MLAGYLSYYVYIITAQLYNQKEMPVRKISTSIEKAVQCYLVVADQNLYILIHLSLF